MPRARTVVAMPAAKAARRTRRQRRPAGSRKTGRWPVCGVKGVSFRPVGFVISGDAGGEPESFGPRKLVGARPQTRSVPHASAVVPRTAAAVRARRATMAETESCQPSVRSLQFTTARRVRLRAPLLSTDHFRLTADSFRFFGFRPPPSVPAEGPPAQAAFQKPARALPSGDSRSFSKARSRIWRMRSRVTPMRAPMRSSVIASEPSSRP